MLRGNRHDDSKFDPEEFPTYVKAVDKFAKYPYGSKGHAKAAASLGASKERHYKLNRHHPEYFRNGINGMNLVDLLEMLSDWKSATQNHPENPGNMRQSMEIGIDRYNISPQLATILYNTARDYEML